MKFETGSILASASLAMVIVSLPVGVLANRIGARVLAVGAALLLALTAFGQGIAGDYWSLQPPAGFHIKPLARSANSRTGSRRRDPLTHFRGK